MTKSGIGVIVKRQGNLYVALCRDLDIASQGPTIKKALANLGEAIELFLQCADHKELKGRLRSDSRATNFESTYEAAIKRRIDEIENGSVKPIPWKIARRQVFAPPKAKR